METSLVIILGPTGVGKSELAMALAEGGGFEIVSADVGHGYRGFDIGTAKPGSSERGRVPHHCLDLFDPDEQSDAVRWVEAADRAIADIVRRGRRPLVVGGTAFYIRALIHGLFASPDPDPSLRARLKEELQAEGGEALHRRLAAVDPEAAAKIHPNDPVRLVRALEVYEQTGRPLSEHQQAHRFAGRRYRYRKIALARDRTSLYRRIDRRVEQMIAAGWVEETQKLLTRWGGGCPPFRLIGYRQIRDSLQGRLPGKELVPLIQQASRNYAKRQLTWLKKEPELGWLELSSDLAHSLAHLRALLNKPF